MTFSTFTQDKSKDAICTSTIMYTAQGVQLMYGLLCLIWGLYRVVVLDCPGFSAVSRYRTHIHTQVYLTC